MRAAGNPRQGRSSDKPLWSAIVAQRNEDEQCPVRLVLCHDDAHYCFSAVLTVRPNASLVGSAETWRSPHVH
jgi:hypothetical protein